MQPSSPNIQGFPHREGIASALLVIFICVVQTFGLAAEHAAVARRFIEIIKIASRIRQIIICILCFGKPVITHPESVVEILNTFFRSVGRRRREVRTCILTARALDTGSENT